MIFKTLKRINIFFGILAIIVIVDFYILPGPEKTEKLNYTKREVYSHYGRFTGRGKTKTNYRYLKTENYNYMIQAFQKFKYWEADSIRLSITPVLRQVKTGFVTLNGKEYELAARWNIFNILAFIPVVFCVCAITGLFFINSREQTVNFFIVNTLLFIYTLFVLGYF